MQNAFDSIRSSYQNSISSNNIQRNNINSSNSNNYTSRLNFSNEINDNYTNTFQNISSETNRHEYGLNLDSNFS